MDSPPSVALDDWDAIDSIPLAPDGPTSPSVADEDTIPTTEAEAVPIPAEEPLVEENYPGNLAEDPVSLQDLADKWKDLQSLLPVLGLLPAFQKLHDVYVLSGSITDADVDLLFKNAQHVKTLTLSTDQDGLPSQISPSVYVRLVKRLRSPLLPSLWRLQLPFVTTSLMYLPLFLSPSLQYLEVSNIHPGAEHLVIALLNTLPWEAPALNHLVLRGPLQLQPESLRSISELKELRHLHLDGIVRFEDFKDLANVGTLPHLEDLILDLYDSNYKSVALPDRTGFTEVKTLRVTASFPLIHDLLHHIASDNVQQIDLIPTVDFRHDPKADLGSARLLDEGRNHAEESTEEEEIEELIPAAVICRHKRNLSSCKHPGCGRIRASYGSTSVSAVVDPPPPAPKPIDWLPTFKQCIAVIISRWQRSMTSIGIDIHDIDVKIPARVFELPEIITQSLTQLHLLESLRISQWKVTYLDSILQLLLPSWPSLKELCLPLGDQSSGLQLSTLRAIAEFCPLLRTIQACIDLTSIPSFQSSAPFKYALQRELRTLSVASPASTDLDTVQLLAVARQLNILFPLVNIKTHGFESDELWQQVHEMLKIYQGVREDDRNRRMCEE